MATNLYDDSLRDAEVEQLLTKEEEDKKKQKKSLMTFLKKDIRWRTTLVLFTIHLAALYGIFTFPYIQRYKSILWAYFVAMYTMFGINGGVHRYWCHKSYKANVPLRMVLAFCYLSAAQVTFKKWVQYHRLHHRYMETSADPHNSQRGFWFSHIGWLMIKRTPEVTEKIKGIDLSDMDRDPVTRYADKYYLPLCLLVQAFSVAVPVYLWNETWYYAFLSQFIRYAYTLNAMFAINSFAHMWGNKPYDTSIAPVENRYSSWVSFGEGWHNYHHTFPHDYRTPEYFGFRFDLIASFIKMFSYIGWAYDLKKSSDNVIKNTIVKKGDGTLLKTVLS